MRPAKFGAANSGIKGADKHSTGDLCFKASKHFAIYRGGPPHPAQPHRSADHDGQNLIARERLTLARLDKILAEPSNQIARD